MNLAQQIEIFTERIRELLEQNFLLEKRLVVARKTVVELQDELEKLKTQRKYIHETARNHN